MTQAEEGGGAPVQLSAHRVPAQMLQSAKSQGQCECVCVFMPQKVLFYYFHQKGHITVITHYCS